MPRQGTVAVSLAAKQETDGYGFWAAVRNRNLLDVYQKMFVRQDQDKARCRSPVNPAKIQPK